MQVIPWYEYIEREMENLKCTTCKNLKIVMSLPIGLPETENHTERICQKAEDGHIAILPYRLCASCSEKTKTCIECGQRRNDVYYHSYSF